MLCDIYSSLYILLVLIFTVLVWECKIMLGEIWWNDLKRKTRVLIYVIIKCFL